LLSSTSAAACVSRCSFCGSPRDLDSFPTRRSSDLAAKQESHFFETARGIRSIKLFGRRHERREAWLALLVDQLNAGLKAQRLTRSEEHTSELQSRENLVCRLLLEKTKIRHGTHRHS